MKKVSVFTMLMCFLAGTASFPCYAGGLFSSDDKNKSKGPTVKQKEQQKGIVDPNMPKDFDAFAAKSGQPENFDPVIVEGKPTAQQIGAYVQQVVEGGGQLPSGVIIQIHMPPAQPNAPQIIADAQPNVPAALPAMAPLSLQADSQALRVDKEDEKLASLSEPLVVPETQPTAPAALPAMALPCPQVDSQGAPRVDKEDEKLAPPSVPVVVHERKEPEAHLAVPSGKNSGKLTIFNNDKLSLSVPSFLTVDNREHYQLVVMPSICEIHIYQKLDKAKDKQFLKLHTIQPIVDKEELEKQIKWIEHYLKFYARKHNKYDGAMELMEGLRSMIENRSIDWTQIRTGHDKDNKRFYLSIEIVGGHVIFAKIPGVDY